MNILKRIVLILSTLTLGFVLVACGTDTPADNDTDIDDGMSESINLEASTDSDYAGIVLILDEVVDTVAPDGAAAGTLQVVISFQNTTDETITLPFVEDDYVITDSAGLDTVPSTASPELVMPEIGAGETVTGTLEYAVVDAEGTFTFEVGDFQDITFSS